MTAPKGNKLHIGIFGSVNSGKSTLFNTLSGESVAIVSSERGTTTDAVYKATEISSLGAVILVDTAGFNDETNLGADRIKGTKGVLDKVDMAILVMSDINYSAYDREWIGYFNDKNLPFIKVFNTTDKTFIDCANSDNKLHATDDSSCKNDKKECKNSEKTCKNSEKTSENNQQNACENQSIITVNALTGEGVSILINKLISSKPISDNSLLRGLVNEGDTVLLVMPQDEAAPNARLILPEAMTIRELIDKGAISINCNLETLPKVIANCGSKINLIITDSSVFKEVERVARGIKLTSFSVLYAGLKGDIDALIKGSCVIDSLNDQSKVLILEACSHVTTHEDIGRVKIPRLLRSKCGQNMQIDFVRSSGEIPDMTGYDLVIHCGGCMITARSMMSRMAKAESCGVSMTNYGIAIAKLSGVLDKIVY